VVEVRVIYQDGRVKEMEITEMPIEDLLEELGINPVEVIIAKNGKIVPEDEMVRNDDELKIIMVKHGG
jgi:sulfur carrier protein